MKKDIMNTYLEAAVDEFYKYYGYAAITDDQIHVVQIGQSIMMHRDGLLNGGGFVTAFVNNDLMDSISRADKTVINHFPFFANVKRYAHVTN